MELITRDKLLSPAIGMEQKSPPLSSSSSSGTPQISSNSSNSARDAANNPIITETTPVETPSILPSPLAAITISTPPKNSSFSADSAAPTALSIEERAEMGEAEISTEEFLRVDEQDDLMAALQAIERMERESAAAAAVAGSTSSTAAVAAAAAAAPNSLYEELLLYHQENSSQQNLGDHDSSEVDTVPRLPHREQSMGSVRSDDDRKPAALPVGVYRPPIARNYFSHKRGTNSNNNSNSSSMNLNGSGGEMGWAGDGTTPGTLPPAELADSSASAPAAAAIATGSPATATTEEMTDTASSSQHITHQVQVEKNCGSSFEAAVTILPRTSGNLLIPKAAHVAQPIERNHGERLQSSSNNIILDDNDDLLLNDAALSTLLNGDDDDFQLHEHDEELMKDIQAVKAMAEDEALARRLQEELDRELEATSSHRATRLVPNEASSHETNHDAPSEIVNSPVENSTQLQHNGSHHRAHTAEQGISGLRTPSVHSDQMSPMLNAPANTPWADDKDIEEQRRIWERIRYEQERRQLDLALRLSKHEELGDEFAEFDDDDVVAPGRGLLPPLIEQGDMIPGRIARHPQPHQTPAGLDGSHHRRGQLTEGNQHSPSQRQIPQQVYETLPRALLSPVAQSSRTSQGSSWRQPMTAADRSLSAPIQLPSASTSTALPGAIGRNEPDAEFQRNLMLRRGQRETVRAVQEGRATIVECLGCRSQLQAPINYALVYCPTCGTVSPLISEYDNIR